LNSSRQHYAIPPAVGTRHKQRLEWQEDDLTYQVLWASGFGDGFQVIDALANGDAEQVCVDDARKGLIGPLAAARFGEEIIIAREQRSAEEASSIQEIGIRHFGRTVVECRDDIDVAQAKSERYGPFDMLIHIDRNGHQVDLAARRRSTAGLTGVDF
jgi:hypothetical protein